MNSKSFVQSTIFELLPSYSLTPLATIFIPPLLLENVEDTIKENVHPAWNKMLSRGRHFVLKTNSLDDLTEVADWSRTALVEPAVPLSLQQRIAYQSVIKRVSRWAVLEVLGSCHCIATQWKDPHSHSQEIKLDGAIKKPCEVF